MDGSPKVGIIAGIGDRRKEDNEAIGSVAASIFDELIIRQDKHLRGRSEQEIVEMMVRGIKQYDPEKKITIISNEKEAISYAIENAKQGSLIVICSDSVTDSLLQVQKYKEEEASKYYKIKKNDIPNRS